MISIRQKFWSGFQLFLVIVILLSFSEAYATEEYARKTGKGCTFCHLESTGGAVNDVGFSYIKNDYQYPIPKRIIKKTEALRTPFYKKLKLVLGYIHLLIAMVFVGTIVYVHLFIKPTQLTSGIPLSERKLGVFCMVVLTVTGIFLTWRRIDRLDQFFNSTFGSILLIKICLFVLMVLIGITAITIVNRKMQKAALHKERTDTNLEITLSNLQEFDGSDGRKSLVVYQGKIYDVTGSPKWEKGRHFGKHQAGADLTGAFDKAPHGPEIFEGVKYVGDIKDGENERETPPIAHRIFVVMAYINLVIVTLIVLCVAMWRWGPSITFVPRSSPQIAAGASCVECHKVETPGIYFDWHSSLHSSVNVDCYDCHKPLDMEATVKSHLQHDSTPISLVVSPKNCAFCHSEEYEQYQKSKHAHTREIIWKIDKWLNDDMNNEIERISGCYTCHGTLVELKDGKPKPGTWPNVGVGRINPDGTSGSCSSCHTRHKFSIEEARKPEACDQCHLGPDHPQIEIYNESKHGTIYHAEGNYWNWDPDDRNWTAGRDYRAPTCAACHMSKAPGVDVTHDVTERLSWETQAPLTVRPADFKPFPANSDWKAERQKMGKVCLQCHSSTWVNDHFSNLDDIIHNYNENYYKPMKAVIDDLYSRKILSDALYFDEYLEWEFYELWHHEGRRARMGSAMMAPDYAWWHGFYELKHRYVRIMEEYKVLLEAQESPKYKNFPGRKK